jgi:redox-sensing transcriptional repressor
MAKRSVCPPIVRIIFNYSEALLDVPHDVQVHTSNPAVELLHALYFHLA